MSRENVEVVRRAWNAYREGGLEAGFEYFAKDCVSHDFPEMPDRATYFAEIWGDFAMEPVEFIDAGDGTVVAVIALSGQGKGSGAPLDAVAVFVYELRDGEIAHDRAFTSKTEALEAVGLLE